MPFGIMLLIALAITIGVFLLLYGGMLLFSMVSAGPIYIVMPCGLAALVFLTALGILHLPAEWRIWATIAAVPLVVGAYCWTLYNYKPPER